MMHAVRGYSRFARIDGLIAADPAVSLMRARRLESSARPCPTW